MARTKRRFYRRVWLNRPGFNSHAHILAQIKRFPRTRGDAGTIDAFFSVADCNRVATLEFFMGDDITEESNQLRKIELLVQAATDFRDALVAEYESLEEDRRIVAEEDN